MDGDWEICKLWLQKGNEKEIEKEEKEEGKGREEKGKEGKELHKSPRASVRLALMQRTFLDKKCDPITRHQTQEFLKLSVYSRAERFGVVSGELL